MLADATEGSERAGIYSVQSIVVGLITAGAGTAAGSLYSVNLRLFYGASLALLSLNVDICVLGGSCTGVFAAERAARLGASSADIRSNARLIVES